MTFYFPLTSEPHSHQASSYSFVLLMENKDQSDEILGVFLMKNSKYSKVL